MQGMERAYNFHKLVGCANILNHLAAIKYGENGLKFNRQQNKQKNIWAALHLVSDGQSPTNLGDYFQILTNVDIVGALKDGMKEA